ncbi:MAG: ATP-binding protein [Gammaproteobacteria bacterium]|nr:ATP-binding protein [Gammaproteobacteria bacterium]
MNADIPQPQVYRRSQIPARADQLKSIRELVNRACAAFACTARDTHDIIIAVDESCQNIVRYAYNDNESGIIDIDIQYHDSSIEIRIRDYAKKVDPAILVPTEKEKLSPGGLGILLIQKIMDVVKYLPVPDNTGNILFLSKKINKGIYELYNTD